MSKAEDLSDELVRFLAWRDIELENVCTSCGGSGRRAYASTATWHGGIGGQAITGGVCDKCWGSGDKMRPGYDQRKHLAARLAAIRELREHVHAAAVPYPGTLWRAELLARLDEMEATC